MSGRREFPFVLAALTGALAWTTVRSWSDLVEQPGRFVAPALVGAVLVAGTGALLRSFRVRWWLVLGAQVAVVTAWFHHRQGADTELGGWLPTPSGMATLADQVRLGAEQVNTYTAPVGVEQALAPVYLLATALGVALVADLICCGLRRAPWTGLPVLVALTVPISVLDTAVPWTVLATAALLYLAVIAYAETAQVADWGYGTSAARRGADAPPRLRGAAGASGIAAVTVLAALTVPALLPLGPGIFDTGGGGTGTGGSGTITLTNPLVDLRRDLARDEGVPLVEATSDTADPSYLRLAVLDDFDGKQWTPSSRDLPVVNRAEGSVPAPEGVTSTTPGRPSTWQLETSRDFETTWLPVPTELRSIVVDKGDWRYDRTTLDIASVDRPAPRHVIYRVDALAPVLSAPALDAAGRVPAAVRRPLTVVPRLDPRVTAISRQVTAQGRSDYQKMVLLQNWFRTGGGFSYSLDPAPGSGMTQLVRFLTTDRVGYCEQFAAAMAVMARALDVPARVVVGFLQPERPRPGTFLYTSSDLHAWPEIFFRGYGWVRFEPTPAARTGAPPSWTREDAPAPVLPTPSASPAPVAGAPTRGPVDEPVVAPVVAPSTTSRGPVVVLACGALVLLLASPRTARALQRRRRLRRSTDPRATLESLWAELHARAIDLGIRWPEGRSVREIGAALLAATSAGPTEREDLEILVTLVERARYAPNLSLTDEELARARAALESWGGLLGRVVPPRQARVARWFPRSVLLRERPGSSAQHEPDPRRLVSQ